MFENIQEAMSQTTDGAQQSKGRYGLTVEEEMRNYTLFSELMKKGVRLDDLVERAEAPREPAIDESLFRAMETAVGSDNSVAKARKSREDALKRFLVRLAEKDPEYQQSVKDYRDAVVRAYTDMSERRAEPKKG